MLLLQIGCHCSSEFLYQLGEGNPIHQCIEPGYKKDSELINVQPTTDEVLTELQQRLQEGWPAFTGVMATCEAGSIHLVSYVRSSAVEIAQQQPNVTAVDNRLAIRVVPN